MLLTKGEQVKKIALLASVVEFLISIYTLNNFSHDATTQFGLNTAWVASLGISFHIGIDGISMLMVLLTTFLVPVIILSSFKTNYRNPNQF